MILFANILVPVDYSDPAAAALELAARLACAAHGRLLVAHVVDPIPVMAEFPFLPPDGEWLRAERARLEAYVRGALEPDGAVPSFEVEVVTETPALGIVQLAAERRVDLIVMGTHGRTGLRHLALGSVTEKVVRLAPCPVLTVHGDAAARPTAGLAGTAHPLVVRPGTVAELVYRNPVTVESTATLAEARRLLATHAIRHLPVVDAGKLVGILSDADLGPYVGYLDATKVNAAMTPNPTTIASDANAAVAAHVMLRHKVRALPVTDGDDVVGVVSVSDVLDEYVRAARAARRAAE